MLRKAIVMTIAVEQVQHNLTPDQIYDFFQFGQDTMKDYLAEHPVPQEDIDNLIDRVGMLLDRYEDIEESIYTVVSDYVLNRGQYKNVVTSVWLDEEVGPLIEDTIGYQTTEDDEGNIVRTLPSGLGYMKRRQIEANEIALAEAVLDGLQTAEEQYLEDFMFKELQSLIPSSDILEEKSYATV